jgi:phage terminase large subunit-like protein
MEGAGLAHNRCNVTHGAKLGAALQAHKRTRGKNTNHSFKESESTPAAPFPNSTKEAPRGPVERREVADGVLAPRLETKPHRAVQGSYGGRAAEWLRSVYGMELRGWQRYALERMLEHDAQGDLVWSTVIVTVARQSGKSYLTRAACMWRMHEGRELWGEEQTIIHVANKRETALEVMRPAGLWAAERYGNKAARWGAARAGIDLPSGDRWIIHAANAAAGVGFSVGMVFVDEAWQVERTVVDDGLAPTMLERRSPQLVRVSTAGDSTSDLLMSYRQRAIDRLDSDDPGTVLLLEWSAPPDADPDDEDTWTWASPEWTERRHNFLRAQHTNIEPAAFAT